MIGLALEPWRSKTGEVGWLGLRGGVTGQAPPAVVTPPGICSVMGRCPADCALWVVPQSLRDFTSNTRPCLAARHRNTASRQGLLEGTTFRVPLLYVQRLMRAAQSPREFVVARFMLSRQRAQATGYHEQGRGLRVSPKAGVTARGSRGTEGAEGAVAAARGESDHDEDGELRGPAHLLGQVRWNLPKESISLALGEAREKLSLLLSTMAPEGVWGT